MTRPHAAITAEAAFGPFGLDRKPRSSPARNDQRQDEIDRMRPRSARDARAIEAAPAAFFSMPDFRSIELLAPQSRARVSFRRRPMAAGAGGAPSPKTIPASFRRRSSLRATQARPRRWPTRARRARAANASCPKKGIGDRVWDRGRAGIARTGEVDVPSMIAAASGGGERPPNERGPAPRRDDEEATEQA